MSQIEDLLRDTFRELAATSPATEGIAERAITRAHRINRGRAAVGSLVAVVCVVLVSLGIARGPRSVVVPVESGTATTSTNPAVRLPDLLIEDRLVLASGEEIRLTDLVPVTCAMCHVGAAWRVPDGWLVMVHDAGGAGVATTTLWLVPESGSSTVLVVGEGSVLVSPGTLFQPGIQVVWVADGRLRIGRYAGAAVTEWASTPIPFADPHGPSGRSAVWPQAVVGDAVVVLGTRTDGGGDVWDVWFPYRDDYLPMGRPIIAVNGVTVNGERLIVQLPGPDSAQSCLGEIGQYALGNRSQAMSEPLWSLCPSPVAEVDRILPSPDDRWWLIPGRDGPALFDADVVRAGYSEPVSAIPVAAGPYDVAWLDDDSFVVLQPSGAVIVHTAGQPAVEMPLAIPADVKQFSVVADLR